ncbi:hypothetical protein ACFWRV_07035 [Streptomyces sp. NPDC058576]|uniref:hypothetical protein n=1 Tax=Streptomyces sp. NPDC058576 TaxID=3346547 RepID=UPI00364F1457
MRSRSPWKPLRLAAVLAAISAATLPLAPSASPAAAEPAGPVSRTADPATSIVYDPGVKWRCYSVSNETGGSNYGNDSRDCGNIDHPNRVNAACTWFGYTSPRGVECPAWRFVTYNWEQEHLRTYPGYDHQVQGNSGTPLKLVLQNNSRGLRNVVSHAQNCELKEVAVSHEYVGSSFKRKADGSTYNFADGQVKVSYDALVEQTGGFACEEKRALLTTDFIYRTARGINVISVVHFDPGPFSRPNDDGVLWSNNCRKADGTADGCRMTVYGERLTSGERRHLEIDFSGIATKYRGYLNDEAVPVASQIEAVQVVNSAKGADLKAEVSGLDVTLR